MILGYTICRIAGQGTKAMSDDDLVLVFCHLRESEDQLTPKHICKKYRKDLLFDSSPKYQGFIYFSSVQGVGDLTEDE